MYIPLNYDKINLIEGTYQPSPIKNRNNASFDFWVRSLFHRAGSTLIFGVPDYWQGRILEFWYYILFKYGYLSVQDLTDLDEDGEKIGMCFITNGVYDQSDTNGILNVHLKAFELLVKKEG
jgi:hypothetical protein